MAPPHRPPPRKLEVLGSQSITPNMLRVTLGGEALADFPRDQEGGYVKLNLPPLPGTQKPTVRTYTIRNQRCGVNGVEIDVDFALHTAQDGSAGPATEWAMAAKAGEVILVGGPGAAKPLPSGAARYVVAGDMTALPAIGANLERLDREARGVVFLEIQHEDDRQDIDHPAGVEIRWLVNPQPGTQPNLLEQNVRSLDWEDGTYAWAACEFSSMRALRSYLLDEQGLGRDALYISSYWKSGLNEDSHKLVKREDAEAKAA